MRERLFVLVLAGLMPLAAQAAEVVVPVTVTAKGCEPSELTVKAGTITFQVLNKSSRALEWEILKGVMVVDERENIVPGFRQRLRTTLEPGTYEMTCGLLSNPRGKLVVLNADGGQDALAAKPSAVDLIGPVAEYRVWAAGEAAILTEAMDRIGKAKAASNSAEADAALAQARGAFQRLGVLAGLTGGKGAAAGEALKAGAAAEGLDAKVAAFVQAVRALTPAPDVLIAQAVKEASGAAAQPGEAPARLSGVAKVVDLFDPLATRADSRKAQELREALARAKAASGGDAAEAFAALSQSLAGLPAQLGL